MMMVERRRLRGGRGAQRVKLTRIEATTAALKLDGRSARGRRQGYFAARGQQRLQIAFVVVVIVIVIGQLLSFNGVRLFQVAVVLLHLVMQVKMRARDGGGGTIVAAGLVQVEEKLFGRVRFVQVCFAGVHASVMQGLWLISEAVRRRGHELAAATAAARRNGCHAVVRLVLAVSSVERGQRRNLI